MATITIPGMFLTGTHASRPAASAVGKGTLYACSDHNKVYQSDGSSWSDWYTAPSAALPSYSGAGAYNSSNLALSTSGEAALTMNTDSNDVGGYHDTGSNTSRLTVPTGLGGTFLWTMSLRLSGNVVSYAAVRKNGSAGTILGISSTSVNNGSINVTLNASGVVALAATDYIEIYAVAASAVNAVAPAGGPTPWLSISRIGS